GITCEGPRPGPLGGPGPWWPAVRALEAHYGAARVLHVSLEEFGRNLSAEEQERDRWREGGRSPAEVRDLRRRRGWRPAVGRMRRLFRRYRALGRPNLMAIFGTYAASPAFGRDFPEAIEAGPLRSPIAPARDRARRKDHR